MAKKKTDDDNDKFEKIDDQSLAFLEQVRKGKARNFVMSVKGSKVRSLLVKKKRIKKNEIKDARGGGFQPMFGVVVGQAAKIAFSIARSDGFEEDPLGGNFVKLKAFLKDQTGKAYKPSVEVVATPPAIPFDDEDLSHPLIDRFMKLEPMILTACDSRPDRIEDIQKRVNEVRLMLQDEETLEQAGPKIDQLEKFLQALISGRLPETEIPEAPELDDVASVEIESDSTEPSEDDPTLAKKLTEGLKKLKPAVQDAIATNPDRKGELVEMMGSTVNHIKDQQYVEARESMLSLGALVKQLRSDSSETSAGDSGLALKLAQRMATIEPRLHEAQKRNREKAPKLAAVFNFAREQSDIKNFEKAHQALDGLETAINEILSSTKDGEVDSLGVSAGLVEKRRYLVTRFKKLPAEMRPYLEAFESKVIDENADDDPEQLISAIEESMQQLYENLQDVIDESITTNDPGLLKGLRALIDEDEVLKHLLNNPFTSGSEFKTVITRALDEVEQQLAG